MSESEARVSRYLNLNSRVIRYSNVVLSVPHSRSINSNVEANLIETRAKLQIRKMLMIFVIII